MNEYELADRDTRSDLHWSRRIRVGAFPAHRAGEQLVGVSVPSTPGGSRRHQLIGAEKELHRATKKGVAILSGILFVGGLITTVIQVWS